MPYRIGIIPLDVQLNGGIPEGRSVLLLDEPGAGGEVFSYHFAVEGIKVGEKVLYISTGGNVEDIRMEINSYFKIKEQEYLTIISLEREKKLNVKDYLKKYDPMNSIKATILNEKFNRIILNDLVYFLKNYELENLINFLHFIFERIKNMESSFLALLPKGLFEDRVENYLKYSFDVVFELSVKEVENEVQRRLKVLKFRGSSVPRSIMKYEVTDRGIKMEALVRIL
ncbi:MAG: RAD55 family ATPase [Archaeoglobaceae archaeon]|nr:RAD55 family ATPase [Archaeoglobaceae archaeon]MCX8151749.1 RAD55 family ATPase [Archaeoglobaceae archaeon]MDW8014281.1 RAD55 family ATPase [Archaeoglobaceae archaeon]